VAHPALRAPLPQVVGEFRRVKEILFYKKGLQISAALFVLFVVGGFDYFFFSKSPP
jgi:hypothetical protein